MRLLCVCGGWIAARGGVRDGGPVLRRQGQPERVVGQGGVARRVQPLPDLGHLRLVRQRPQHHRSRMAGESYSSTSTTRVLVTASEYVCALPYLRTP
jgi:hypothetical protein